MSGNTFGTLFCVTSFGESHGPAYGGVVDGCPPGLALAEADLQKELDRRKPGSSRHVTQRKESDKVEILSGLYEGKTTGTFCATTLTRAPQESPLARSSCMNFSSAGTTAASGAKKALPATSCQDLNSMRRGPSCAR